MGSYISIFNWYSDPSAVGPQIDSYVLRVDSLFVCLFLVCRFGHSETARYSPYTSLFCVKNNDGHSAQFVSIERIAAIKKR